MNPFTQLINGKINILFGQLEQSNSITHAATKGSLREAYIRNFLAEIVPRNTELLGGFITDAFGHISPQMDLIGIEDTLPLIKLDQGTCVVPLESIRFWLEVKSHLKTEHIEGIKERVSSVESMDCHLINNTSPIKFKPSIQPPAIVVAYNSDVNKTTLDSWFNEIPQLCTIIVIGKYAIWRVGNAPIETIANKGSNEELLFLAAKLHQIFMIVSRRLDYDRKTIASRLLKQGDSELLKMKEAYQLDMIHFSLQTYFESEKLDENQKGSENCKSN